MNRYKKALKTSVVCMAMVLCCLLVSSLEARNVGLFYNAEYLDIMDGDLFAEASNLNSTLEYLGHNVVTFQNFQDIQNLDVDLIIIPELEKLSLLSGPVGNQIAYLQSYIDNGGGLILMGVVASEDAQSNNAIDLMNFVLDSNITGGAPVLSGTCTKSTNLLPGDFEDSPNVINNNNAIVYLENGFVEGIKVIFHNTEKLSDVAVAQFPLGSGSVVYFGWGWWNAFPVGSQDGGWLALLDETIEALACGKVKLSFDDLYTFSIGEDQSFILESDVFKESIKSCSAVDIQLSKTKFDCEDIGTRQTIMIKLVKESGWEQTVAITLEIVDPNNYCGLSVQEFTVLGMVQNAANLPIQDVVLSLDAGEYVEELVSDENGQIVSSLSALDSYTTHLNKDIIIDLAITARDLRMLSRHLLGIEKFTSPYQYIAADINGDGKLDFLDEILIRKVLLFDLQGDEVFAPRVQFVSKSYMFRPGVSPLLQDWDTIQGSIIDADSHELNVILIKLGDIDFSIQ